MLYWISIFLMFPFFKIYHRAERVGIKNVPWRGPFIVIANHASFMDPWYLSVMFRSRCIHYLLTTKWYSKSKLWKWFFDRNCCIPMTPDKMELSAMKRAMRVLKKGGIIGIFPEGRVCHDGELQEFNTGAIYLARKAKVPILPVTILGSYDALPRNQRIPKPAKIKIVIGEMIRFSNQGNNEKNSKDRNEMEMQKIKDWIKDQIDQFRKRKGSH